MTENDVRKLLGDLPQGSLIELKFKSECIYDLAYLEIMARGNCIAIDENQMAVIREVQKNDDWKHNQTRKVVVQTTESFDVNCFDYSLQSGGQGQ